MAAETGTPSELATSEMPVSELGDGEATPMADRIPTFPPYPPYATEPAPPSVADAIIAGHDLRLKHKSVAPKPVRLPPKPARPRGPKATDVKLTKRALRAHARCLRKHGAILTDRLERMAKPLRRNIIYLWREHAYTLPPETISRLRSMLDADEPFKPDQAYEYFVNLKKTKKKVTATARVNEIQKDVLAMVGEKKFLWARNATVAFARGIQQRLSRPGRYALADGMLRLSNIILDEICGYMHMRTPSRRCTNPKAKFMMEMSDKVAVWIDEILSESDDRMLMMDFDEDEDILMGPDTGGGGERFADDFLDMMGAGPAALLSQSHTTYSKFDSNMKKAFDILTDSMEKKGDDKLLSHGKFNQTYLEGADTLRKASDLEATDYNMKLADKVKNKLAATIKDVTPDNIDRAMKDIVDICSKYLAQNAEFNKAKGPAFKVLVNAMRSKPNDKLYQKGKIQRTNAQAADKLDQAKGLDTDHDDPNLSQEIHSAMMKLVKDVTPEDLKKEMTETVDNCSKYLSEKTVDEIERGPVFDLLIKELNKHGGDPFSDYPALKTKHTAAYTLTSAPGLASVPPDPKTIPEFTEALHKAVDFGTPQNMKHEMNDVIDRCANYLSGFIRDRGPAMDALVGMMKSKPKNVFAKRNDYTLDYETAATEAINAPTLVPYLPVKDIAEEGKQNLTRDMKDATPSKLKIPMQTLIQDVTKHLSQGVAMRSGVVSDRYPMNFLAAVKNSMGDKPLYKYKDYGQTYADAADTLKHAGPLESAVNLVSRMNLGSQQKLSSKQNFAALQALGKSTIDLGHEIASEMKRGVPGQLAPTLAEELQPTMDKAAKHLANVGSKKGKALEHLVGLMQEKGEVPMGQLQGYEQTYNDGARRIKNAPTLTNEKVDKGAYESVKTKLTALAAEKPISKHAEQMPGMVEESAKFLSAPIPETPGEKRTVLGDLMGRQEDKILGEDGIYKMTYKDGGQEVKNAPMGVTTAYDEAKKKEMEKKLDAVIPDKKMAALLKEPTKEGAAHLTDVIIGRGEAMEIIHEGLKKEKEKEFIKVGDFNKTHEQAADMLAHAPNFTTAHASPVILEKVEHQVATIPKAVPADKTMATKHIDDASKIASKYIAGVATENSGLGAKELAALDESGFNAESKAAKEARRIAAIEAGVGTKVTEAGLRSGAKDAQAEDMKMGTAGKKGVGSQGEGSGVDETGTEGTGRGGASAFAAKGSNVTGTGAEKIDASGKGTGVGGSTRADVGVSGAGGGSGYETGSRGYGPGGVGPGSSGGYGPDGKISTGYSPGGTGYAPDGTVLGPGGAGYGPGGAGLGPDGAAYGPGGAHLGPRGAGYGPGGAGLGPGGVGYGPDGIASGPDGVGLGPGGAAYGQVSGRYGASGISYGTGGDKCGPGGVDYSPVAGETEEQRRRRLAEAEAYRKYEEEERRRLGDKEYFRRQAEKRKLLLEAGGQEGRKYRGGALGADYDPEHEAALDILHRELRAFGPQVFYEQPQTSLTHKQASDWLAAPYPMRVDKSVRDSGDTARLHKKFERKLNALVGKVTPANLYDSMQDVVIESARRLSEFFVSTNYKALVREALISEMQKRGNEIFTEVDGAAETFFFAAQRLKKTNTLAVQEPCYQVTHQLTKKLEDIIRYRSLSRKLTATMKEHVREAADYLSALVTKPDDQIEAYVALLNEMEAAGDNNLINGDIPKSHKEAAAYLRQLTSFEDQIRRPNSTMQAAIKNKLANLMSNVPPSGYSPAVMDTVIADSTGLLVSYIMLQGEKTEALKVLLQEIEQAGEGMLLRHGTIRKSFNEGADLLRGKTADQLSVPSADPVVSRKIQIRLNNLMLDKTPERYQALMDDVIEDVTMYLAVELLQPQVIQVCKCMKNVFVQCELWSDEILRRVVRPCCTCSRHVSAQGLQDLAPAQRLRISPGQSRVFAPGLKISITSCPSKQITATRSGDKSEPPNPCPALVPTPGCRHGPTTSYLLYATKYKKFGYNSLKPSPSASGSSYSPPLSTSSSSSSPVQLSKCSSPFKTVMQDMHSDNVHLLTQREQIQSLEAEKPKSPQMSSPSFHTPDSHVVLPGTTQGYTSTIFNHHSPTVMFSSVQMSDTSGRITQAKSGYSSRTPISTDQMADWHAMMVSLMWNVQAWRDWIQEIVDRALAHQHNPNLTREQTADNWTTFHRRVSTEALQWRQYSIFSRQLTTRLVLRYKDKEIVSPKRCTVKTKTYLACLEELLDIIDMLNRWTQWLTVVVKETDSLQDNTVSDIPLHEVRWNHFKKKAVDYSKDWVKYNRYLKLSWEQKYSVVIADYLPSWKEPGPVWVVSACGAVPSGAVAAGVYDGEVTWVARTTHKCNVLPAALYPSKHCCFVYAEGAVHRYTKYQVMCNADVRWVAWRGGAVGARAVRVAAGTLVGRVHYRGDHLLGSVLHPHYRCHVVIFGRPFAFNCYELLVLAGDDD